MDEKTDAKEDVAKKPEANKPQNAGNAPKKDASKPQAAGSPKTDAPQEDEGFRHKVRVAGIVLDGNRTVVHSIRQIQGIGQHVSKSLIKELKINEKTKLGELDDKQIENLEKSIKSLDKYLPSWMLNRQKDFLTGSDMHLTGADLQIIHRADIDRLKKMRSYKGVRHSAGLPVRGQRTRTSFRGGPTLGVTRKKVVQATAKKPDDKGGKK